jgi:hypothetical protein
MSEEAQNGNSDNTSNDSGAHPATQPIEVETYSEMVAKQETQRAAERQAIYDYQEAAGRYGTTRHLRTPDGLAAKAYHTYTRSQPARSRFRGYQTRPRNYGGGRSYSESFNSSAHYKASAEDTHMYMHDCVPSGWWYSFWHTVGALLSGRR